MKKKQYSKISFYCPLYNQIVEKKGKPCRFLKVALSQIGYPIFKTSVGTRYICLCLRRYIKVKLLFKTIMFMSLHF